MQRRMGVKKEEGCVWVELVASEVWGCVVMVSWWCYTVLMRMLSCRNEMKQRKEGVEGCRERRKNDEQEVL